MGRKVTIEIPELAKTRLRQGEIPIGVKEKVSGLTRGKGEGLGVMRKHRPLAGKKGTHGVTGFCAGGRVDAVHLIRKKKGGGARGRKPKKEQRVLNQKNTGKPEFLDNLWGDKSSMKKARLDLLTLAE